MNNKPWFEILDKVTPYIFKIQTPNCSGTGFQVMHIERTGFCGVATADHVISHEDNWEQPIKIIHEQSGKQVLLKKEDRVIKRYPDKDLAFILFHKADLPILSKSLQLVPKTKMLRQGVEVGWYGFPSVAVNKLCFFAGHISCRIKENDSYLVDGVAINGVSGGPVFNISLDGEPMLAGVVSAYKANRATGEALPGLCVVQSVEPYQDMLQKLRSLEDAKENLSEKEEPRNNNKEKVNVKISKAKNQGKKREKKSHTKK